MKKTDIWLFFFNVQTWRAIPPLGIYALKAYLKERHISVQDHFVMLPLDLDCLKNFSTKIWRTPSVFSDFLINQEKSKAHKTLYNDFLRIKQLLNLWVELIGKKRPSAIGVSIYYNNLFISLLFAKEVKRKFPDIGIIIGGPEVSEMNRGVFLRHGFADVVIHGEGEEVLYQTLIEMKRKSLPSCKRAMVKRGKDIIEGEKIIAPLEMSSLPVPDFDSLNRSGDLIQILPVAFNRGCVNRCAFCNEALFWKGFRQMDVSRAVEGLSTLKKKYGVTHFFLSQSLMNGDIKWLEEFASSLTEKNLNLLWGGNARIHPQMNHEYIKTLYKAGCRSFAFGIESASQNILKNMKKGVSIKTVEDVLKASSENGIWVHTFWIFGFPGETEKDLIKTVHFLVKNHQYINSYRFYKYIDNRMPRKVPFKNLEEYISVSRIEGRPTSSYFGENSAFFIKVLKILGTIPPNSKYFALYRNALTPLEVYRRPIDHQKKKIYGLWMLLTMHLVKCYIEEIEFQENIERSLSLESFSQAFDMYLDKYNVSRVNSSKTDKKIGYELYELLTSV